MNTSTRPTAPNAALLGAFWFGIQMVWGALLGISLQSRSVEFYPHDAVRAYGILAISGACVAAVTQILAGILSDRRRKNGSRRLEFYACGAVTGAAAVIWFYLAPDFVQLVAALLVLQLGLNIAIGPYQAAIPDFVEDSQLGGASAWMAALQSLGNVAGALAASFVKSPGAVGGAIAAALLSGFALTAAHVRTLEPLTKVSVPLRITRVFTDLFISRAFMYVGFYTLLGYLYFYVARLMRGDPRANAGELLVTFLIAAAIGATVAGRAANRFDRRGVAAVGGCIFIFALGAFLFSKNGSELFGAATLAGVAWGVFLTADWALGCAFLPRGALATSMGIWNLALLIPQILAPWIVVSVLSALNALQSADAPRIAFVIACLEVAAGVAWLKRLPGFQAKVHDWRPSGNNAKTAD
jgi:maltose/moltooligosaccharide transporter